MTFIASHTETRSPKINEMEKQALPIVETADKNYDSIMLSCYPAIVQHF
jgi:hypothetical protein